MPAVTLAFATRISAIKRYKKARQEKPSPVLLFCMAIPLTRYLAVLAVLLCIAQAKKYIKYDIDKTYRI